MSKKEKTTSQDKAKQKKSKESKAFLGKEKLMFVVVIVVIVAGVLGFFYIQSSNETSEDESQLSDQVNSDSEEFPLPSPSDEIEYSIEQQQLEQYIKQTEDENTADADIAGAYLNAALLAAKLKDDRAPSLASAALDRLTSLGATIDQSVESLLRGIVEGDLPEDKLENELNQYAPRTEELDE